jgi:hypothetical protein
MIRYYRENETGDYLTVNWDSHERRIDHVEGRATAIEGLPESMCTTGMKVDYVRDQCTMVSKAEVPDEWLKWMTWSS